MWNDTDTPLAYFISFRCYGTWLHGDERGSIDRHNNAYDTAKIPQNDHWQVISQARLKHDPVGLDARRRYFIERAIRETCEKRNCTLFAINIRTNHVHTVVAAPDKGSKQVLIAFKANATRVMRENGTWNFDHSPWSEKGSRRNLWNERSVANAIDYTLNEQGGDLPNFE